MSTFKSELREERAALSARLNSSGSLTPIAGQVGYLIITPKTNLGPGRGRIYCNTCGSNIVNTYWKNGKYVPFERLAPSHMLREQRCFFCLEKIRGD